MHYSERDGKGYGWLFFNPSNQWKVSSLVSLAILAVSIIFFVWCTRVSDDMGGDSFAGLVFAVASTVFMFLAAISFSLRRRSPKRSVGTLNGVLNWHVCFGTLSLVMVFMHAFGNYNPRTGTYALYGMIALVISGAIGRLLDRMVPRMLAGEVNKVLTAQGEDRVDSIWRKLQTGELQNPQNAFYARYYPGTNSDISTIEEVQGALKQEMFLRCIIRYWRVFHIMLAVVTVGVTLWHIEYALALIIPTLTKYGFGYLLPWP